MPKYQHLISIVWLPLISGSNTFAQERIVKNTIYLSTINQTDSYILVTPKNYDYSREYPMFVFMHGLGYSPTLFLKGNVSLLTNQDFYILLPQAPKKYNNVFSWYNLKEEGINIQLNSYPLGHTYTTGILSKILEHVHEQHPTVLYQWDAKNAPTEEPVGGVEVIIMTGLDSTQWSEVNHAYGFAYDIPDLSRTG